MSAIEATPATTRSTLDIGGVFRDAWRVFLDDIGPLLIATLIAFGLSVVTLGILAGPLFAGLYGMVAGRLNEGRRPEVGDVFACMDRFWSFFGAALALAIIIGLAWITIIGGVLLTTIWIYVFPLMVERRMRFGEALRVSNDMVMRAGFWDHFALVILLTVVGAVASGVLGVLTLLTTPFTIVAVAVAFRQLRRGDEVAA
jgi:hypothetical protein